MIKELLERFKISQASFGRELGYKSYAGLYKAFNNPKQEALILSYLKEKILREHGLDVDKIINSLK